MSKNNHARTKEKRKVLRLKNFFKRVFSKRLDKQRRKHRQRGLTLGWQQVKRLPINHINGITYTPTHFSRLNQRQRRRRFASNPHLRRKAA